MQSCCYVDRNNIIQSSNSPSSPSLFPFLSLCLLFFFFRLCCLLVNSQKARHDVSWQLLGCGRKRIKDLLVLVEGRQRSGGKRVTVARFTSAISIDSLSQQQLKSSQHDRDVPLDQVDQLSRLSRPWKLRQRFVHCSSPQSRHFHDVPQEVAICDSFCDSEHRSDVGSAIQRFRCRACITGVLSCARRDRRQHQRQQHNSLLM